MSGDVDLVRLYAQIRGIPPADYRMAPAPSPTRTPDTAARVMRDTLWQLAELCDRLEQGEPIHDIARGFRDVANRMADADAPLVFEPDAIIAAEDAALAAPAPSPMSTPNEYAALIAEARGVKRFNASIEYDGQYPFVKFSEHPFGMEVDYDDYQHLAAELEAVLAERDALQKDADKDGPIVIGVSATADTRSGGYTNVSKDTLLASSVQHINDVRQGLQFFARELARAAERHDTDKITDIDGFHADFVTGFAQRGWWDRHRKLNRHHLLAADGVPEDVNLVDVLDMIADCVMAGMARTGTVYPLDIPAAVLRRAFENTVTLLQGNVRVDRPAPPTTPAEEPHV